MFGGARQPNAFSEGMQGKAFNEWDGGLKFAGEVGGGAEAVGGGGEGGVGILCAGEFFGVDGFEVGEKFFADFEFARRAGLKGADGAFDEAEVGEADAEDLFAEGLKGEGGIEGAEGESRRCRGLRGRGRGEGAAGSVLL